MHGSQRTVYACTYFALLGLLALTVFVAYLPLGPWNVVAATGIAVCKTLLIALFFMHIRHEGRLVRIFSLAGIFWLGILLLFLMSDYLTRR